MSVAEREGESPAGMLALALRPAARLFQLGSSKAAPGQGSGVSMRRKVVILGAFCLAQLLDIVTTHIGLSRGRQELNGAAAWIIAHNGELAVYGVKLLLVGGLVGLLLVIGRRRPAIWTAYLVAAWITTFAVVNNIYRILN